MTGETYRRGQIVWALWECLSRGRAGPVPKVFITRVRKMGELGVPMPEKDRPGQPGTDIEYTAENAFELGVSFKCLDIGLKQAEVAFFIQHIRDDLRKFYQVIMTSPPSPRQQVLARDCPNSPAGMVVAGGNPKGLGDPMRSNLSDNSYYMTFRSVEIREAWGRKNDKPLIFVPRFHRGLEKVTEEVEGLAHYIGDDIRIVMELGNFAMLLTDALKRAPVAHRGRS